MGLNCVYNQSAFYSGLLGDCRQNPPGGPNPLPRALVGDTGIDGEELHHAYIRISLRFPLLLSKAKGTHNQKEAKGTHNQEGAKGEWRRSGDREHRLVSRHGFRTRGEGRALCFPAYHSLLCTIA